MSKKFSVAAAIRVHRQCAKLTQAELADRAKVSRPTVAGLEAGIGRYESLSAVLAALGLRLDGSGLPQRGAGLGERIAAARQRRGWSVAQAAERASLSAPTVRAIERTGRGRLETLSTLTEAVGGTLRAVKGFYASGGAAFTSRKDEWWTPPDVLARVLSALGLDRFDLDPCSPGERLSTVPADRHLTVAEDGLTADWGGSRAAVFCNPPYSAIPAWLAKCEAEAVLGARIVALVPARAERRAWYDYAQTADVLFLAGRLKFGGPNGAAESAAPFGSALLLYGWPPSALAARHAAFPRSRPSVALRFSGIRDAA